MMKDNPGIMVNDLVVGFDGHKVLDKVGFNAGRGKKISLAGPSGAGKTTLLNVLMGFQPADAGTVEVLGINVLDDPFSVRMNTSFVPQDFNLPVDTTSELLLFPFGFKRNESLVPDDGRIKDVMRALGLEDGILLSKISEISGGQKQRVVLASAILLGKPLMVLDEPFSALDENTAGRVISYLLGLEDITVIASTHNPQWSERANQSIVLEHRTKMPANG